MSDERVATPSSQYSRIAIDWAREQPARAFVYVFAVFFWGFATWYTLTYGIAQALFGILVLGSAVVIYSLESLEEELEAGRTYRAGAFAACLLIGIGTTAYVLMEFHQIQNVRVGFATTADYVVATAFIAAILYLTYTAYGLAFTSVIVAIIAYSQFGNFFPGWLYHAGLSPWRGLEVGMLGIQGVYGGLTQTMATMVAPFLLLAGLMQMFGGFGLIIRFAFWVSGFIKSGIAQMAVISSMLIGSINGSALANTSITGSFTIPVLKSTGIKKERAAAIESIASSGGQILPPVMGVAAFLMADVLDRPLIDIFVAAVVPALVFYAAIVISVYLIATRDADETHDGPDIDEVPEVQKWLNMGAQRDLSPGFRVLEVLQFLLPLGLLFYMLGVRRDPVMISGMYASGAMIVTGTAFRLLVALPDDGESITTAAAQTVSSVGDGLYDGLHSFAPLAIAVAAIGLLVDTLFTTGLPATLSFALLDISGGILALLLVLTMILCIVLGMGMPTSASYLVVALLIAPTLTDFGIGELPAHFFVLYFAVLAAITPPIAPSIVIASGIAQADFWRSCLEGMKLALPVFAIPFAFVYNPELVTADVTVRTAWIGAVVIAGVGLVSYGLYRPEPMARLTRSRSRWLPYGLRTALVVVGLAIMIVPK